MCHYKIMKQKSLKDQLSEFIYLHFHLYNHYIKVYIYIYFDNILYLRLYSQKVHHSCHRHAFQFPICDHKGMSDSSTFTIFSPDQCLVFRNETHS
jgi:hypothetical protein